LKIARIKKKAYPLWYESEKTKLPQSTQPIKNIHEPERTGYTGIFIFIKLKKEDPRGGTLMAYTKLLIQPLWFERL